MRFKCPECQTVLSIGTPKPGKYRPKCKKCGQLFRVTVSSDDPPKVRVRPEKSESGASSKGSKEVTESNPAKSGSPPAPPSEVTRAQLDRTLDSTPDVTETIDSSDPAMADATLDASVSGPEQKSTARHGQSRPTDRSPAVDGSGSHPSNADAIEQTIGAEDPTIQGTMDAASMPSSGQQTSGQHRKAVVSAGASYSRASQGRASQPQDARSGQSPSGSDASAGDDSVETPERLGGYRILRMLGRGAMGAVYEAKQMSLDRLVALKTIRSRLMGNPASLARFTREAYAAAQLTHHNVVQIYDFGEDAGRHFFSMEWVRGGPLDTLVREKGSLDPRLAAGYALQAARGLQFAHQHGMVHRDVKPANLLLSDDGVVKVADLGLVKVPDQMDPESDVAISGTSGMASGTQVTMQGTAVGTPAYMAPEQSLDAATVDHRADIYSLGCTLFYLLTGRPPFEGSGVSEVLEQHVHEPPPDLSELNPRIPKELKRIVERCMAKQPSQRYASLAEMIADLESYLGISQGGDFSPTSAQADRWESIAKRFADSAPRLRLRAPAMIGLAVSGLVATFIGIWMGLAWWMLGPSMTLVAIITALAFGSLDGRSAIVNRLRQWIGSLSWLDYTVGGVGLTVSVIVLLIAGMWPGFILGMLLGAALGAIYHFVLIVPSRKQQSEALREAQRFVRDLRIEGADEEGARLFEARYGGPRWQSLFEALFGYDAMIAMRKRLAADPSFHGPIANRTVRDRVCAWFEERTRQNRQELDHQRLAEIEQRGLQSEGLSESEAREKAWQMAAAVMENATTPTPEAEDARAAVIAKRQRMKAMLADARSGKYRKPRRKFAPLLFLLGGHTRLLAGCLLLAVFAIWGQRHGVFDSLKQVNVDQVDREQVEAALRTAAETAGDAQTSLLGIRTNGWSIGLAGLLLAASSFVSGWRMTPFAVVATVVILFGPSMGIPGFSIPGISMPGLGKTIAPWMVAAVIGILIYIPGVLFGETKETTSD